MPAASAPIIASTLSDDSGVGVSDGQGVGAASEDFTVVGGRVAVLTKIVVGTGVAAVVALW